MLTLKKLCRLIKDGQLWFNVMAMDNKAVASYLKQVGIDPEAARLRSGKKVQEWLENKDLIINDLSKLSFRMKRVRKKKKNK